MKTHFSLLKPTSMCLELARLLAVAGLGAALTFGARAIAAERVVEIHDNFFSPQQLTISMSDTVRWSNVGNNPHTTTSSLGFWNSGVLNRGDSYSLTFSTLGSFPYFCQVHGASMTGTISIGTNNLTTPSSNLFLVTVTGNFKTTNGLGRAVAVPERARELINDCAVDHQLDPASLVLAYDRLADAILVVRRDTGETVCTMITFSGGANVATADGKRKDRQAFVYWEDSLTPSGSIVGTEVSTRGENGELLRYSFRGSIQFGLPNYEGEPPRIFQGSFAVGRRFVPRP